MSRQAMAAVGGGGDGRERREGRGGGEVDRRGRQGMPGRSGAQNGGQIAAVDKFARERRVIEKQNAPYGPVLSFRGVLFSLLRDLLV